MNCNCDKKYCEKITKDFSLCDFIKSETAKSRGINNEPSEEIIENIKIMATKMLQPFQDYLNPCMIIIKSGYRSPELNKAIGGSLTSRHMIGLAVDIKADGLSTESLIKKLIESGVDFDKAINELNCWLHISYDLYKNRRLTFRGIINSNTRKMEYYLYNPK